MSSEANASTSRVDDAVQTSANVYPSSSSSSSNSSATTINAGNDNGYTHINHQISSGQQTSSSPSLDTRNRSVSAPASRSSSFSKNLDQLVSLNQSAHRFPIPIPSGRSRSNSGRSNDLSNEQSINDGPHPIACGSRSRTNSSLSTPSSPSLSPTLSSGATFARGNSLRQFSNDTRGSTAARARATLFSPGSGFTPAHQTPIHSIHSTQMMIDNTQGSTSNSDQHPLSSPTSTQRRRARSTSATEANVDQIEGRTRANSSSAGSSTSTQSRSRRARAQSARTSPVSSPNQLPTIYRSVSGESVDGGQAPQRTSSVPHLANYSPIIYSYGFHPCDEQGRMAPTATAFISATPGDMGNPSGYFALPPAMSGIANPLNLSPREADELPPPYTPSEPNLAALNIQLQQRSSIEAAPFASNDQMDRNSVHTSQRMPPDGEDDEEDDDSALSFSTNTARIRASQQQRSTSSHRRQTSGHGQGTNGSMRANGNSISTPQTLAIRSEDEAETEREGSVASPSLRSTESLSSPVARNRVLEGEPLAEEERNYIERLERPSKLRQFVLRYLVHPLRLLATVPGIIGTFWLLRNAFLVAWKSGVLWRKPVEGMQPQPSFMEFGLSALYSITTALHALSFTTLLLRRWLHYYSLFPSLIRLLALQALCWPLVRLTLFIMGPRNPLPAWIIISTTTACSDTVARWVVSNITDESDGLSTAAMGIEEDIVVDNASMTNRNPLHIHNKGRYNRRGTYRSGRNSLYDRNSRRSHSPVVQSGNGGNKPRGGMRMAFWRAIMGAPPRQKSGRISATLAVAEHGRPHGMVTESEAESEAEPGFVSPRSGTNRFHGSPSPNIRRRRVVRNGGNETFDYTSEGLTSAGEGEEDDELGELPLLNQANHSSFSGTMQNANIERVGRIFHWDVAIKRNILPIGILAYMTMWLLLIEDVRLRW